MMRFAVDAVCTSLKKKGAVDEISFRDSFYSKNRMVFAFGVCRGHGPRSGYCTRYVSSSLVISLRRLMGEAEESIEQFWAGMREGEDEDEITVHSRKIARVVKSVFRDAEDRVFGGEGAVRCPFTGVSACVVIVLGTWFFVFNSGDCEGVLYNGRDNTHSVAWAQTADCADEMARIRSAGGFIGKCLHPETREPRGLQRVWVNCEALPMETRVECIDGCGSAGLYVTRCIGSTFARDSGVICDPVMSFGKMDVMSDIFLVVGTCKFWKYVSHKSVARMFRKKHPRRPAKALAIHAERRRKATGCSDEGICISVLFVK